MLLVIAWASERKIDHRFRNGQEEGKNDDTLLSKMDGKGWRAPPMPAENCDDVAHRVQEAQKSGWCQT